MKPGPEVSRIMMKQGFTLPIHFEALGAAQLSGNFPKSTALIERRGVFGA
jgi:hypothetical protein